MTSKTRPRHCSTTAPRRRPAPAPRGQNRAAPGEPTAGLSPETAVGQSLHAPVQHEAQQLDRAQPLRRPVAGLPVVAQAHEVETPERLDLCGHLVPAPRAAVASRRRAVGSCGSSSSWSPQESLDRQGQPTPCRLRKSRPNGGRARASLGRLPATGVAEVLDVGIDDLMGARTGASMDRTATLC